MKSFKILLFAVIVLFIHSVAYSQSITVTSPNGGENWIKGTTRNITWTSSGITTGTFTVRLFDGTTNIGIIQAGIPCTDGAHSIPWIVGNLAGGGTASSGSNYLVKVRQASLAPKDFSNAPFTISASGGGPPTGSIVVISPTSMWSFNAGGGMNIGWRTSEITGVVKISLNKEDGTLLYLIKDNVPYNQSSIRYEIPSDVPTGKYFIKVEQGVVIGKSGNFRINAFAKSIIVSNPYLNSLHLKGKICNIQWFSSNVSDEFVKIYLKPSNNLNPMPVANPKNSNGRNNYVWNISKNIPNGDYKIIIQTPDGKIKGESKVFKIIDKLICNLGISNADFCSGKLNITLKNYGDHFVGNLFFFVKYKKNHIWPLPKTYSLIKNSFVLFSGKTLNIEFKDYRVLPNINSCSEKFDIELKVDNEHLDVNTTNNKFSGTIYKDCNVRDCEKPDIFIDKIWTNFGYRESITAGDNVKTYAELKQSGKVYKSYSVRLNIYYHKEQFDQWELIKSKDFFINNVDFYKKVLEYRFTPQNRGYYVLSYKIDTYRIIEERDNRNNLKKKEIFVWERR